MGARIVSTVRTRRRATATVFLIGAMLAASPGVAQAALSTYFNGDIAPNVTRSSSTRTVKGGQLYGLFGAGGIGHLRTLNNSGIYASITANQDQWVTLSHGGVASAVSSCLWKKKYSTVPNDPEYLQCLVSY